MKVFVIGAHGQIGQRTVEKLAAQGDQVTAGVRDPETQAVSKQTNVDYVAFDLNWSEAKMATTLSHHDVVIFTAGSAGRELLKIDLDGAVKTMNATEKAGIKRYFLVSSVDANHPEKWSGSLHDYFIAKHYADEWLTHRTDLDYVIIRPVALTNEVGSGAVDLDHHSDLSASVSRDNVADLLVKLVHRPELKQLEITVSDGGQALDQAIDELSSKAWEL
ncbi:SDR family oxidoreductase [Lapidilactobacillus luobeiensis]|uniref:SDR family oxidoreductase n=1 Tax=Lapidilactobacillus luobeiensis TaxID=2950371 RepID=UPI0021C4ABFE|nr:SDR family oxidoreductase [Lapidilactobacillus luobeiensis]